MEKSTKPENISSEQPEKEVAIPKSKSLHKKRNILIGLCAVLVLFVLTPVFIAGYLGLVPGLSSVLGANKPRDLGVTYTQDDIDSYLAKTKTTLKDFANAPVNPQKTSKKIVFDKPIPAQNLNVTQEELTAMINESGWSWMPISNAQVKLTNGVVEISGNMQLDNIVNFVNFIGGVGYSQDDINAAVNWGKRFVNNAPIYIKANGSVANNQLSLDVQQVVVGRYAAPNSIAQTVLATGTQNAINKTSGLDAQSATLIDGQLQFSGTHPSVIYVKKD